MPRDLADDLLYRLGTSILGTISGLVAAIAVIALCAVGGVAGVSIGTLIFGGAIAGGATGLLFPDTAMALVQLVIHFVFGILSIETEGSIPPTTDPKWLAAAFFFGAAYIIALRLLAH